MTYKHIHISTSRTLLVGFLLSIISMGFYSLPAKAVTGASMYFLPKSVLRVGSSVAVQVRINSNGQGVNAVQSDFTYPAAQLTLTSINASDSAFDVDAATSGAGGNVSIARGATVSQNGDLLVATVNFTVNTPGTANFVFQNPSVVVRTSDSTDILTTKTDTQMTASTGSYGAVYRMANWKTKERLFTTDAAERDYAVAHYEGWVYEGVSYYTFTTQPAGTVPVYRMANWKTKERLFTTDAAERDYAVAHYEGWVYEGVSYYTYSSQVPGTVPVYRMANWKTKERLFTTDAAERDYAVAHYEGWVYEGVSYYTATQ